VTSAEPAAIATVSHAVRLGAAPADTPRKALPSEAENRVSIALEPIVLDQDVFSQVAFQLTRMAEGIGITTACPEPTPSAPVTPTVVDTTPPRLEPIAASDDLELSELGELCRVALETRAPVSPQRVAARKPREVEQPDDDSFVCGAGDGDLTLSTQVATSKPMPGVTTETAGGDFVAISETDLDFCSGNGCLLDSFIEDAPTPPPVALLADLPQDVFGPSAKTTLAEAPRVVSAPPQAAAPRVATGPRTVVALADLPRDVFAPPEPSPKPNSESHQAGTIKELSRPPATLAQPRLGHAVELTRDALYAWMNVLKGPALVDVTSR